jgi:hypothetical protein
MKRPNADSMPQIATSGPGGTPKRLSISPEESGMLRLLAAAFRDDRVGAAPLLELLKREPEAALAAIRGDRAARVARGVERGEPAAADARRARASCRAWAFHASKPVPSVPQGIAAAAPPAIPIISAAAAAARL